MSKPNTYHLYFESPVGLLEIIATDSALTALHFMEKKGKENPNALTYTIKKQLDEYFNKKRHNFTLPLAPEGTTFQKKVWNALQKIPFGSTISYGMLAEKIANKKAVRAVGSANGRNPIPIIIPCHRVIGADGSLTGYSGGLWRKEILLSIEEVSFQKKLDFYRPS